MKKVFWWFLLVEDFFTWCVGGESVFGHWLRKKREERQNSKSSALRLDTQERKQ